jgi:dehydratase
VTNVQKWGRRAAVLAVSLVSVAAGTMVVAQPAQAATVTTNVPYICQTRVSGEWLPVPDYSRGFDVTAPTQVAPQAEFRVSFDPKPILAAAQFNKEVRLVTVTYALPPAAKLVNYQLSGGSGLGASRQLVVPLGDELVVMATGPLVGGVEFDLPTLDVTLRAPSSGTLVTGPGGSSFQHIGFGWWREQTQTLEWDPFQCYPDPTQPVQFSSTTVG